MLNKRPTVEQVMQTMTHKETAEKLLELAAELEPMTEIYDKLSHYRDRYFKLLNETGHTLTPIKDKDDVIIYDSGYFHYLYNFHAKAIEFMTYLSTNCEPTDAVKTKDGDSDWPIKIEATREAKIIMRHLFNDAMACGEQVCECWQAHEQKRHTREFYILDQRENGDSINNANDF